MLATAPANIEYQKTLSKTTSVIALVHHLVGFLIFGFDPTAFHVPCCGTRPNFKVHTSPAAAGDPALTGDTLMSRRGSAWPVGGHSHPFSGGVGLVLWLCFPLLFWFGLGRGEAKSLSYGVGEDRGGNYWS